MPANILHLPQYRVIRVEEADHNYHVTAEPVDVASSCPHCQSDHLTSWGTREVFKGKRVGIYIDYENFKIMAVQNLTRLTKMLQMLLNVDPDLKLVI